MNLNKSIKLKTYLLMNTSKKNRNYNHYDYYGAYHLQIKPNIHTRNGWWVVYALGSVTCPASAGLNRFIRR